MNRARLLSAVGILVVMLIAAGAGIWQAAAATGEPSPYRYGYARPAKGAVLAALEAEIAFYQDRIARDPSGGLDLAALGMAYLKMARATGNLTWYLLAEQAARRSLGIVPGHTRGALLVLAKVAEARHDFARAVQLAREAGAEGLAVITTAELARGRAVAARRAAQAFVERSPGLGSYTLAALAAAAAGRGGDALAGFRHALAAEEAGEAASSAYLRTVWGRFHSQRGQMDLARELYLEALRILPQYPPALINLAELELRQGNFRAAEDHLTRVVTLTADAPTVYDHVVFRGLARARTLGGDAAGARRLWEMAESRLRRDVTAGAFGHRRELAVLLLTRGSAAGAAEALALLRQELRVRRDPETLDAYAWALVQIEQWEEAAAAMREALAGGIREARLFYRAAVIERHLGHHAAARRLFRLAEQTDPTFDARARKVLGLGL